MFRRKRSSERRLKVNRSKKRTKSTQDDDDDDVVFLGGPGCLDTLAAQSAAKAKAFRSLRQSRTRELTRVTEKVRAARQAIAHKSIELSKLLVEEDSLRAELFQMMLESESGFGVCGDENTNELRPTNDDSMDLEHDSSDSATDVLPVHVEPDTGILTNSNSADGSETRISQQSDVNQNTVSSEIHASSSAIDPGIQTSPSSDLPVTTRSELPSSAPASACSELPASTRTATPDSFDRLRGPIAGISSSYNGTRPEMYRPEDARSNEWTSRDVQAPVAQGAYSQGTSAITQYVTKTSSVPSYEPSYQPVISGQSQPVSRLDHRPLALRTVPRPMVTARRPPRHTAERTPPTVGASYTSVYAARPAVSRFRPSTYTLATSVDQTAGYRTGNRELYN
eukprot:135760_1